MSGGVASRNAVVSQNQGYFFGVVFYHEEHILIVLWGLYWGPPNSGNYDLGFSD